MNWIVRTLVVAFVLVAFVLVGSPSSHGPLASPADHPIHHSSDTDKAGLIKIATIGCCSIPNLFEHPTAGIVRLRTTAFVWKPRFDRRITGIDPGPEPRPPRA